MSASASSHSAFNLVVTGHLISRLSLILITLMLLVSEARPQSIQPWINVRDYGAVGNGVADDTQALLSAIAAAQATFPRSAVYIPAGTYRYSRMIKVDGLMVYGEGADRSILLAANPGQSSWILTGRAPKMVDLRIRTANTQTTRNTRADATGIDVVDATQFAIQRVHIGPVASAGIIVRRSSGTSSSPAIIRDCIVQQTMADGIHITENSEWINVTQNEVFQTGDDFIAVVSYRWNARTSRNITITKNVVSNQHHGRGISVVGGEKVTIDSNVIEKSSGAGIYLASESSYNTYGVSDIVVRDNTLYDVAQGNAGHGGIHLTGRAPTNGSSNEVSNIVIQGNRVSNALGNGVVFGTYSRSVTFEGNEINGAARNGIILSAQTRDIAIIARNGDRNVVRDVGEYGIYVKPAGSAGTLRISGVLLQNLNTLNRSYVDAVNIERGSTFTSIDLENIRLEQAPEKKIERFIESASPVSSAIGNSANRALNSVLTVLPVNCPLP